MGRREGRSRGQKKRGLQRRRAGLSPGLRRRRDAAGGLVGLSLPQLPVAQAPVGTARPTCQCRQLWTLGAKQPRRSAHLLGPSRRMQAWPRQAGAATTTVEGAGMGQAVRTGPPCGRQVGLPHLPLSPPLIRPHLDQA
ncbi:unnamed protein product [Protopolystoma xenopodis]|uniref:Uncharacterized protein n=1 Tax=Protopolystoma xenopodis TaxID=117903 RepID=A0A3S5CMR6_9PLAT|nr:unnamed protein product [Protopolystoma xenopodis]